MRKVDPEKMTTPTLKIITQVYIPYNDGSNSGEMVEATEMCYLNESGQAIGNLCRAMISDAKAIAMRHQEIIAIRNRRKGIETAETDQGVDLAPAPVTIRKAAKKKASKK